MSEEKKCPQCAEMVKADAKVCRFCGYDFELKKSGAEAAEIRKTNEKSKSTAFGCLALIGLGGLLYLCTLPSAEETAQKEAETAEDKRKGFHCLSAWDGSYPALVAAVKENLRDPESFEHDETRISPVDAQGNHAVVMSYRARNGFGGMNGGTATATVSQATCEASEMNTDIGAVG